ncbi:hypothetical protein HanXRQr2_Chr05g0209481 [Helianthus annuus]|uniref:Uncharacterized protein n=1 Tax=Helianthus annuus TaxID=4232 RepID=A0A9K3NLW5_HELAN|nr:hypothetical protein HanXRQr2_Chr05g0209481 [Helianthus annuus]KAJ0922330.1 hypothetical protein HanPSC8_Chr05g0202531 [Helianthus annuus]
MEDLCVKQKRGGSLPEPISKSNVKNFESDTETYHEYNLYRQLLGGDDPRRVD